ncbi:AAA family ATPase [Agrobacterium tumefaciens]|uniref:ATP-binding protein n=1 Tax=Agrobacterium tumefaciens TaxID=358 RepID=UPI0021CE58EA|nr:ATP-binding protein [Agrobacterium tumefaciens]UXT49615.1 AAA family ATPase [Agrobacterium tumefaciens]
MFDLKIRNIGKISDADIGISSLTLLVGRNNTGKSYAAALIWSIFKMYELFRSEEAEKLRPKWLSKLFDEAQKEGAAQLDIKESHADQLVEFVNKLWDSAGEAYLDKVFAFRACQNSSVAVQRTGAFIPFNVTVAFNDVPTSNRARVKRIIFEGIIDRGTPTQHRLRRPLLVNLQAPPSKSAPVSTFTLNLIFRVLLGVDWQNYFPVLYIPAGRTGLMTGFKAMQAYGLEGDEEATQAFQLSAPVKDFLQDLTFLTGPDDEEIENGVASWIESEILHGALHMNDEDAASVTYRPAGSDADIPLHAASSMITELAPFLLTLRENPNRGLVIFEEPEAHLHLAAQRLMARGLARMVNSGMKLVVTTHSDTFVQQINNLMTLHGHTKREQLMPELGYACEDLIDPAGAEAFEFLATEGSTRVERLTRSREGFIVPSLNETLYSLAKETVALQEDNDE